MRRYEREVIGKELICKMLDMMDTIYVGMFDEDYPYVVPMNFGYEFGEKLVFYFHSAKEGKKAGLLAKNPSVCVTAARFFNFPDRPYKKMQHDYRSVMAFGVFSVLDPEKDPDEYTNAVEAIQRQYNRKPESCKAKRVPMMIVCKIECDAANVTAKAEFPVRSAGDVPFADVYSLPEDNEPFDISDLLLSRRPSHAKDY
ncbi:MAG: pyridoxamine 5'-phosphate oxidase family protein [Christensenellales bacterium]